MTIREEWTALRQTPKRAAFLDRLRAGSSQRLTVGIFSSTTWRPIVSILEGELLIEGVQPDVDVIEYEAMSAELANGTKRYDLGVLAIDDVESYGSLYSRDEACPIEPVISSILARADRLADRCSELVVLLPSAPEACPHGVDATVEGEPLGQRVRRLVYALDVELRSRVGVVTLDVDAVFSDLGRERALDSRMWEIGRIRYSTEGFVALSRALAPIALAGSGRGIKAIILDLDNTLWGGVVGEDGADGIELGGDYPGSCYREFQRELLRFKRAGVLFATASKNNAPDAHEVIDHHPEMVLRSSDFSHHEIHWEPKSVSVGRILQTFNIGAESVLFIDDNPRERAAVAAAFPTLRMFDFPDDPLNLVPHLKALPWPVFGSTSEEDQRRGELQRQQAERAQAKASGGDDYLQSLRIEIEITVDERAAAKRVAQLHQKTNQFNVRPIRHVEADIRRAMDDPDASVVAVRYRDRFGEAGIVGCAVVRDQINVETLLLSCRVIGLGVERALLSYLTENGPVRIPYTVTEKNAPAIQFLDTLQDVVGDNGVIEASCVEPPAWIRTHDKTKETSHA